MGDKNYDTWLLMLFALQYQFRSFMDGRPGLTKEMNMHDLHTGVTHQHLAVDDDLDELADLEERSLVLEQNLCRAMTEILRSQNSMSQWLKLRKLQRRLRKLQDELRAAMRILVGMSTQKYMERTFSRRSSIPELKRLVRERCPLRFQSCPNIPSEGIREVDSLKKSWSVNRTISFKRSIEDSQIIKILNNALNSLSKDCKVIKNKKVWLTHIPGSQRANSWSGYQGEPNSPSTSTHAGESDSSRAREAMCESTRHSSEQRGQHHLCTVHNTGHSEHWNTECESQTQRQHSQSNNPGVSPSQRALRAVPQSSGTVHRATIQPSTMQAATGSQPGKTNAQRPGHRALMPLSPGTVHRATIQNTECESQTQRQHSQSNNPEVSPSQRVLRAVPQSSGTVHRATIQEPPLQPRAATMTEPGHIGQAPPTPGHGTTKEAPPRSPPALQSGTQTQRPGGRSGRHPPGHTGQAQGSRGRHRDRATHHREASQPSTMQATTGSQPGETNARPRSQNVTGISHSRTSASLKEAEQKRVPPEAMKTNSAKSSGSPLFSLAYISTAIYKTMAASCAAILIFL